MNVYGPNHETDRVPFLDKLQYILSCYDYGDQIVIGGDFNFVLNEDMDKLSLSKPRNFKKSSSQIKFENIMSSFELVDIWRKRNENKRRYTWSQPNPSVKCRLDYFIIQNNMSDLVRSCRILPSIKSDHSIIDLVLTIQGPKRGPGFWKLNVDVLKEMPYISHIKTLINDIWFNCKDTLDLGVRFDWLKYNIRKFSIEYCKQRAKNKRNKEHNVIKQLEHLDEKICEGVACPGELNQYNELKNELESIEEERARGVWIRSRLEHIESDEKSSAFFFNKSKVMYQKKTITNITLDTGYSITDPKKILKELENFYKDLYTSKRSDRTNCLLVNDTPLTFTEPQKVACEGMVTLAECFESLKSFKPNKSPGSDGLPAEFYLAFWTDIGPKLVECLNFCKNKGQLSLSQRRGMITLLEKKGRDSTKIKNWRPVALLNTDYKIFTKSLSRRLEKHIANVINPDQSGFVSGRYIGESIRFVEDIIEKFDREDKEGIILQLDFEKAFDSVEWEFMFEVLRKFNLGDEFISLVKCCYTNMFSCVSNNGFTTNWFELFRGVRQGCPLSCILFILCVEIMSNRIRNNINIRGLNIGHSIHKLKQFADDCTCFLRDIESIYTLIETVQGFSLCSGLKLNADKSVIFFLGPWKNKDIDILNMKIERSTINTLGVHTGRMATVKETRNFSDKIPKIEQQFHVNSQRDLSICGRILVTKTLGFSKIIYPLSTQDINLNLQNKIQSTFNRYIWNYKPSKVKHSVLAGDYIQGGMRSLDIQSQCKALRLTWLKRILNGEGWNDIVNEYLSPYGGLAFLLRCNYDTKYMNYIPTFYRNMLDFANEIIIEGCNQNIIWNNRNILLDGKSIFYRDWFEKGIIYIHHLRNGLGAWLSFDEFKNKYAIRTNFLKYMGVICMIKNALKKLIVDPDEEPCINFQSKEFKLASGRVINLEKVKSKTFYLEFLEYILEPPKALNKWRVEYGLSEDIFYECLRNTRNTIKEPKLVALQFKILHNITNCRANLNKWNIAPTDICEFCNENVKDDIVHALFNCANTKKCILEVFAIIDPSRNVCQTIESEEFIFGVKEPALNTIFLLLKQYIMSTRTHKSVFSPNVLLKRVLRRIYSDKVKQSEATFNKKWGRYQDLINDTYAYINSMM